MAIEQIAWGSKVSDTFLDRVKWIVDDLGIGYSLSDGCSKLMACIAWESNETFSADVRNMAGSGATGLIQFMPSTARALDTTTDHLARMTPEDQLNYVWKYFSQWKGRLKTLGDIYMAILWPRGVGKSETYVLWSRGDKPTTYRQNSGLDYNKDGVITKAEAAAKVAEKLSKGLATPYVLDYFSGEETPPDATQQVPDLELELEPDMEVPAPEPVVFNPGDAVILPQIVVTQESTKTDRVLARIWNAVATQFTGIMIIVGALLLNPEFAALLGRFTLALARGEASWGAFSAMLGGGLLVIARMKAAKGPKPPIL